MMNKNNEVTMNVVEGFNPDAYLQYYTDGKKYLPLDVQLAWFRSVYPNGRVDAGEPQLDVNREADTFICTARIYADRKDEENQYLAQASARKSKAEALEQQELDNPYNSVQSAALSRALKFAGFWCSLGEEDLTRPVETTPEEETEVPATEEKDEKPAKTSRKRKESASKVEETKEIPSEVKENQEPVIEAEEPAPQEIEEVTEPVEEVIKQESTEEDPLVETETEAPAEEPVVEETVEEEVQEIPVETTEEVVEETPVAEESVQEVEEADNGVTTDEKPSAEELEAAMNTPCKLAFFQGTMKDMFDKCEAGDKSLINTFCWFLDSDYASDRNESECKAAKTIARAYPKKWMNEGN